MEYGNASERALGCAPTDLGWSAGGDGHRPRDWMEIVCRNSPRAIIPAGTLTAKAAGTLSGPRLPGERRGGGQHDGAIVLKHPPGLVTASFEYQRNHFAGLDKPVWIHGEIAAFCDSQQLAAAACTMNVNVWPRRCAAGFQAGHAEFEKRRRSSRRSGRSATLAAVIWKRTHTNGPKATGVSSGAAPNFFYARRPPPPPPPISP
jgi:hypothetical protein